MSKLTPIAFALALSCMAAACPPSPPAPKPTPTGPDGAAVDCSSCTGPCSCACCVMAAMNSDGVQRCREAFPTARNGTCEQVCIDAQTFAGGAIALPTACIAKATDLDQLHACGVCAP